MTFSIVIPTYNGEKYIEEALLSALNQTRPADEIIVSDDNSMDSTLSICERYKGKVKVYTNLLGPSGFVNGWNNAIDKATGDFISVLHQDDLLHQDFLLEIESVLTRYPTARHLFTLCDSIDGDGNLLTPFPPQKDKAHLYKGLEYVKAYQKKYNNIPHIHRCPGVITHRTIFEVCRYNSEAGHIADDDFFYRVGLFTDVAGVHRSLAYYRVHKDSETGSLSNYSLVQRLAKDYIYQVKQWKGSSYLDEQAFDYFVFWAHHYIKRQFRHSVKFFDVKIMCTTIKQFADLKWFLK